jgi:hypothetical protein
MVIFAILSAKSMGKKWMWTFLLLLLYEVFEQGIIIMKFQVFNPEEIVDAGNDLLTGMAGALLMYAVMKLSRSRRSLINKAFPAIIASLTLAYIWVGSYGYKYNLHQFNSGGVNWWAMLCWFLTGVAITASYSFVPEKFRISRSFTVMVIYCIYVTSLFLCEYVAYSILEIREIGHNSSPLIFDVIHGTTFMHFFYLSAPLLFIALLSVLRKLFSKAFEGYLCASKV